MYIYYSQTRNNFYIARLHPTRQPDPAASLNRLAAGFIIFERVNLRVWLQ